MLIAERAQSPPTTSIRICALYTTSVPAPTLARARARARRDARNPPRLTRASEVPFGPSPRRGVTYAQRCVACARVSAACGRRWRGTVPGGVTSLAKSASRRRRTRAANALQGLRPAPRLVAHTFTRRFTSWRRASLRASRDPRGSHRRSSRCTPGYTRRGPG